ncbi:Adenylate kinase [Klebsormidium nitens]|uniref:adenylate kinase n=1 Tax=Klebsormidium nitens TaxID=105231 RepID=A0A1Y1I7I1_KLENI|nr:Adenylate kinase [Klebsormidium nitens]|eukprot:GAQ86924.1 Adenylate kinase [Klebsormidium nitens]
MGLRMFSGRASARVEPGPAGWYEHKRISNLGKLEDLMYDGRVQWVFLGMPGVGKGTYASRVADLMQVPHISAGDLVREELRKGSAYAQEMQEVIQAGQLLPDSMILDLIKARLHQGQQMGERGFILDGFPRTALQAAALEDIAEITLALNLRLREDVLVQKCLGRRTCGQCGKGFNLADINVAGVNGAPRIVMPPMSPPSACIGKMVMRSDDTEEIVRKRLAVYKEQSQPVEDFYRRRDVLLDFDVGGGIPETWPRLLKALYDENRERELLEPEPRAA